MGPIVYLALGAVCLAVVRRVFLPITLRAMGALLLLPLLFTARAYLNGAIYAPIDLAYQTEPLISYFDQAHIGVFHNPTLSDIYAQMIPWSAVVRQALYAGEWPLINPSMLAGDLLAGSAQPAPYDFLNLAGLLLPLPDSINLVASLALLWAAIGAFLLARRYELSEISALFAALAWMASSFILFFLEAALGHTMLLLPLLCVAAIDVARAPTIRNAMLLTVVLTWVIFAGHPEGLAQTVLIASAFGAYEVWKRPGNRGRSVAVAVAGGAGALMLSAVFLLPLLDALPQTSEYTIRIREGSEDLQTMSWKSSLQRLPVNFIPFLYGSPWEEMGDAAPLMTPHHAAIGSIFLGLSAGGFLFGRRRERWFLLALAAVGFLAGIGFPPLIRLFASVPLLALARNARFIAATVLALALLAAIGVERCLTGESRKIGWSILAIAVILLAAVVALVPVMSGVHLSDGFIRASSAALLVPAFLAAAVLLAVRRADLAVALLLALAVMQRRGEVGNLIPTTPRDAFFREPSVLRQLPSTGLFRFAGEGFTLLPNSAAHYGLEDVRGFQATSLQRLQETFPLWCTAQRNWFNRIDSLSSPFLSFLNVRWALHDPDLPLPDRWRVIGKAGQLVLVENRAVLPRAFVPAAVRLNVPFPAALEEMKRTYDFRAVSWIDARGARAASEENGSGSVSILRSSLSSYAIRADLSGDAWIVISQPAWKGWRAFDGGHEIPVRIANHAFLAVRLGKGPHRLDLRFRPHSFVVGRQISFVALAAGIFISLWSSRRSFS